MKTVNTGKRNPLHRRFLVAIGFAMVASTAIADDAPKFTMTVFEDVALGADIIAGHYDKAIDAASVDMSKNDVIRIESNLCVAYAKTGEIERAERACDAAIAAIRAKKSFYRYRLSDESAGHARKRFMAIALSNRSVINAVKGDYAAARKDLDMAQELDTQLAVVKINLERLDIAEQNRA